MSYNKNGSRRRAMGHSPFRYQQIHCIPNSRSRNFEYNELYEPLRLSYQQRNRVAEGHVHPHYYPTDPVSHHHPSTIAVGLQLEDLKDCAGHNDDTALQGYTDSKMRKKYWFGSKKHPLSWWEFKNLGVIRSKVLFYSQKTRWLINVV